MSPGPGISHRKLCWGVVGLSTPSHPLALEEDLRGPGRVSFRKGWLIGGHDGQERRGLGT